MADSVRRGMLIKKAVDVIRSSLNGQTVSLEKLSVVEKQLNELAQHKELFTFEDFPPPTQDDPRTSCLYRLSEDEDHRFALYANVANGEVNAPPHDHTTWAVIVGVHGQEENRFYNKTNNGVAQVGSKVVELNSSVKLLADDLHSIHIKAGEPVLNFHMYGLALEQLHARNYWSEVKGQWKTFPAHTDIREAR
ncbi:cysteine dioxygenase [Sneathiella glossodoripedis]|uniref:cysteine dioxygenase family protein n=1 Tax=Sneathiella glossodoripedis TaxID=418853 RepID=UPI0011DD2BCC|nr:cysteine dioxygenase [Sneathiella glossodoripedis]